MGIHNSTFTFPFKNIITTYKYTDLTIPDIVICDPDLELKLNTWYKVGYANKRDETVVFTIGKITEFNSDQSPKTMQFINSSMLFMTDVRLYGYIQYVEFIQELTGIFTRSELKASDRKIIINAELEKINKTKEHKRRIIKTDE